MTSLQKYFENLKFTACALLLRRPAKGRFHADFLQGVLAILTLLVTKIAIEVYWLGPIGGVDPFGLTMSAGGVAFYMASAVIGALLINAARQSAQILIAMLIALSFGMIASQIFYVLSQDGWSYTRWIIAGLLTLYPIGAVLFTLLDDLRWKRAVRAAVFAVPQGLLIFAFSFGLFPNGQILSRAAGPDSAETESDYAPVDVEELYYAQAGLMAAQRKALLPERAGQTDIYGLMVAGYAAEGVFLREIVAVSDLVEQNYQGAGRVLKLANSDAFPFLYPLANAPNLAASLQAMADTMNPDEDIALLFLTSHGSTDKFALSFWEARVKSLDAQQFDRMLDQSGIRNAVIVVSACHAGSFIDELRDPHRLIIAAAAADKKSFGCADENEWTWFGRAFFDEALRVEPDFRKAFALALDKISAWEKDAAFEPSEPQIEIGAEIGKVLDRYFDQPKHEAKLR